MAPADPGPLPRGVRLTYGFALLHFVLWLTFYLWIVVDHGLRVHGLKGLDAALESAKGEAVAMLGPSTILFMPSAIVLMVACVRLERAGLDAHAQTRIDRAKRLAAAPVVALMIAVAFFVLMLAMVGFGVN